MHFSNIFSDKTFNLLACHINKMYDHQVEDHNGVPPEFKLQSKRYYGKDRLACQVAEGVSIKMRTGKILNSKTDWDAPSLITIERNIHRGL